MSDERPNVILYTTDQHRGDHLSLAGHPVVETPNVDSWIQEGAYFPNAYTEIPSTTGARRVLLGGQASYTCGLIGYSSTEWHERNTLAQVLADAGYHCINVGWRNLHPRRKLYGFHTVIPHDLREGSDDYMEWLRREVGPWAQERGHGCYDKGWQARPWQLDEQYHPTVWTTEVSLEQIAKRDPTRPFFIWISHLRPHSPYDPPQFYWDMYIDRELPEVPVGDWAAKHDKPVVGMVRTAWEGRLPQEQSQRCRAAYIGQIAHLDCELGRMMEALAREGLYRDTLMIFTSDHGDMLGEHHLHRKGYAYEGSARVPLVIKYPQGLDLPTGTFEHVVGLQDIMPTVLDIAGVKIPDSVTGQSLRKAICGEPWREFFHGEHSAAYHISNGMHYLTDGKEKYIWFPYRGQEQLFDLTKDRSELHDLGTDPAHADRVAMWRERLIKLLGERGDGFSDGEKLLVRKDPYGPLAEPPQPNP